jgi:hypothetical protein
MIVCINQDSFVMTAKELSLLFVATIETLGITPVYMPHPPRQIAIWCLDQQMVMVRHQAKGGYPEIPERRYFLKDF